MNDQELSILEGLEPRTRREVESLIRWAETILEDTKYELTIPSYSKPWYGGRRTDEQQHWFYVRGLSHRDGYKRRSAHQDGRAVHLGLRYRSSGRFIRHETANNEPSVVFMVIVEEAERRGFTWGGRWRKLKDEQHFELDA